MSFTIPKGLRLDMSRLKITTQAEKWRLECPNGHKDWRIWDGVFSCETCKRHRDAGEDVASVYEYLIDRRTGARVAREDVELAISRGRTGAV